TFFEPSCGRRTVPIHSIPYSVAQPLERGSKKLLLYNTRILEAFAKQNGFTNLRWYTDDGYSGANCQRPGVQAMLADIEAGKVGTVMSKDMSRLGRNYMQVGFYT